MLAEATLVPTPLTQCDHCQSLTQISACLIKGRPYRLQEWRFLDYRPLLSGYPGQLSKAEQGTLATSEGSVHCHRQERVTVVWLA